MDKFMPINSTTYEMDKSLLNRNLSKVMQVEKKSKKAPYLLKFWIYNYISFPKETPGLDYFTVEFCQIFKLQIILSSQILSRNRVFQLVLWSQHNPGKKLAKYEKRKRLISLVNIDVKNT